METILQYIPAVLSAILLAVLILMVITNIIVEVVKKLTWDKVPTNLLAFIVAMAVTLLAFFAVCRILAVPIVWYMVAAAIGLGFFVAFAAMFGWDKFRQMLEQITRQRCPGEPERVKRGPPARCRGSFVSGQDIAAEVLIFRAVLVQPCVEPVRVSPLYFVHQPPAHGGNLRAVHFVGEFP